MAVGPVLSQVNPLAAFQSHHPAMRQKCDRTRKPSPLFPSSCLVQYVSVVDYFAFSSHRSALQCNYFVKRNELLITVFVLRGLSALFLCCVDLFSLERPLYRIRSGQVSGTSIITGTSLN